MNILQVVPYFFVDWAGNKPVETVYGPSKALAGRGHKVTVYTTDAFSKGRNVTAGTIDMKGFEVCEFRSLGGQLGRKSHIIISPGMIPMLAKKITTFDIVHLYEFRTFQNIVVHHYALKHRVPYVLQAHGSLATFSQKERLKRAFDKLWGYGLLRDAARVIASTKIEAQQCRSMGVAEDRIEIIPNGIDLSEFNDLPEKGEFKKQYNLDDNQRIVLFLARIAKIKGTDFLVRAFNDLSKTLNNVKLVIAGPDDGYLSSLKALVADLGIDDKVLFTGPLYGREKLKAYVDADVYVLPSVHETFGITVLEACACGTPIIVTENCGIADVINNRAGLVVAYGTDQLQAALLKMLSDDALRMRFGANGKQLVYEEFNWDKVAEQMEGVYERVGREQQHSTFTKA